MASTLASAETECCTSCVAPELVNVPGLRGPGGTDGTDGTDGLNAFCTINGGGFVIPAFSATSAAISFNTPPGSKWMSVGQVLFLEAYGYFKVVTRPDDLTATLLNLGYPGNDAGGGNFANLTRVQSGGLEGPAGSTPGNVFLVSNNLSEGVAATMRTNLALGALATLSTINNTLWSGAALAVANGGTGSTTAGAARTALGLGTMAVQDASAVAIIGGALNGSLGGTTPAAATVTSFSATGAVTFSGSVTFTAKIFTTPTALQTLAPANLITSSASKIRIKGSGGPVVMTSLPTIGLGTADGQLLIVQGTDDTNTVTLQDNASLAGSQLHLASASRVLGRGDSLLLSWDSTDGKWNEMAFSNLT